MSTDALYGSCIDETLRLYSASSTSTSSNSNSIIPHLDLRTSLKSSNLLLFPFANITYKYVFEYRGRNSMLSLILNGNHYHHHHHNQNHDSFQHRHHYHHQNLALPAQSLNSEFNHIVNSAVCHGDELFYLFSLKFSSRKPENNRDLLMQRLLLSLWTDFAKHGFVTIIIGDIFLIFYLLVCLFNCYRFAPLNEGVDVPYWPSFTNSKPVTYLIDSQISIRERYRDSFIHFWTRYLPSIAAVGSPSASIVAKPPHSDKLDNGGGNGGGGWSSTNGRNNNNNGGIGASYYDRTSVARLRTFAWSMLALSTILLILIIVLLGLLYYQRRRQTFSAESRERARQTSARALARALATSARQSTSATASTSGLY